MSTPARLARTWVTYYCHGQAMKWDTFRCCYYCDALGCTYTR